MPLFLFFSTPTINVSKFLITALLCMFSLKPYTLAGIEPGSEVPQADAMFMAPRHQGIKKPILDRRYIVAYLSG
jgi:hypothetical protein